MVHAVDRRILRHANAMDLIDVLCKECRFQDADRPGGSFHAHHRRRGVVSSSSFGDQVRSHQANLSLKKTIAALSSSDTRQAKSASCKGYLPYFFAA